MAKDDLVLRLLGDDPAGCSCIRCVAAEEIKRLRAELDRTVNEGIEINHDLHAKLDDCTGTIERLRAENEKMTDWFAMAAENRELHAKLDDCTGTIERLRAELEQERSAAHSAGEGIIRAADENEQLRGELAEAMTRAKLAEEGEQRAHRECLGWKESSDNAENRLMELQRALDTQPDAPKEET